MNVTDSDPAAERLQPIQTPRKFRPLHDRILVRRLEDAPSSALFMPECAQKPSMRGEVVAVGPGKRHSDGFRCPLDVQPGDVIYFGRFTDFDDGELVLIQEADVVGIVTRNGR
jgi:chaperonin GroES